MTRSRPSSRTTKAKYDVAPELLDAKYDSLFIAAKEEAAMINMMNANGCTAGVDNFEDLGALPQLPGVGPQRFPSEYGFGFSAEGELEDRRAGAHRRRDGLRPGRRRLPDGGLLLQLRARP